MLRAALCLALIVSCSAQFGPPIGPLDQFSSLASGWQDLQALGGPALGISSELLQTLAQLANSVFSMGLNAAASMLGGGSSLMHRSALPGGVGPAGLGKALPHPLPPLPKGHKLAPWVTKHDAFLNLLTDKWTGALVKAQFNPGLQGFLGLLNLQDEQEALIRWLCIIYPWDALVPDVLRDLRDSYCSKALPAAAVSRLLGSGPVKGPPWWDCQGRA